MTANDPNTAAALTIRLNEQLAAAQARIAELEAHAERLRHAGEFALQPRGSGSCCPCPACFERLRSAVDATPAESLAAKIAEAEAIR